VIFVHCVKTEKNGIGHYLYLFVVADFAVTDCFLKPCKIFSNSGYSGAIGVA